jgi:hypothetical protein
MRIETSVPKIELIIMKVVWRGVRWEDVLEAVSVSVGWFGGLNVAVVGGGIVLV